MCLAIPGKLLAKSEVGGLLRGRVEFGGIVREACLDFLPEAEVGDYVLVHVGFAITRIDEEEATRTLAYLAELGEAASRPEMGDETAAMIPVEAGHEAS